MVVDLRGAPDCGTAVVQRAACPQGACAVDKPVSDIVERLHAQIHAFASGKRGRSAVFRQVIEGDGIDGNRVTIDTPGTDIIQRICIDAGTDAVNQAIVHQRAGGAQGRASGVDFAAGAIGETAALHVERAARQQFAAVGDIARRGEGEIAVGNSRAAVVDAVLTAEMHITEREQLAAGVDVLRMEVQRVTGFCRTALVYQVQTLTADIQKARRGQRTGAVIQCTVVVNDQRVIGQQAAILVGDRVSVERHLLAFEALIIAQRVLIDKVDRCERHALTAANQTGHVIHHASGAVDKQVAHRLDLPTAVLQAIGVQGGR